ncbi:MAG: hypothetical protein U0V54_07465 [Saprospiraceae bacterium]
MKNTILTLLCVLTPLLTRSQSLLQVDFGKVSAKDFATNVYPIDSTAGAVVLFDKGHIDFVSDNKGDFDVRLKRHCRIHILKNSGFEAATVEIPLYHRGRLEERINQIEAVTYRLENGKVLKTEMDDKSIFKVKHDKHYNVSKFTLPNVKENVIIEFKYQVKSDFIYVIDTWNFQGFYPVLWSELTFEMPQFYGYVSSVRGGRDFTYNHSRPRTGNFTLNLATTETQTADWATLTCATLEIVWGMKNVEAISPEPYATALKNYRAGIGFQLTEFKYPYDPKKVSSDWDRFNKELMEEETFGKQLAAGNSAVVQLLTSMNLTNEDGLAKAKEIYAYIRDHFQVTEGFGYNFEKGIKTVIENSSGKAHEINLVLVAALQHAGFDADAVLFSTRDHGLVDPTYPLASDYNGVLCRLKLNGKKYILNPSAPGLGFGHVNTNSRNGFARSVGKTTEAVYISPDSILEKDAILIKVIEEPKGSFLSQIEYRLSPSSSHQLRVRNNFNAQVILDQITEGVDKESLKGGTVDSLNLVDEPLLVSFRTEQSLGEDSFIYFNPFQWVLTSENPFKSKDRLFPVEFPNLVEELYICTLPIPSGYRIESLPKSQKFSMDSKNAVAFEITASEAGGFITIRSRLKINKATFLPHEYRHLKETFDFVANKHGELIVFRKI